ncbi:FadR/GntR family transcriptional regulator [Paenibacillus sp. FSL H7-0331]|uniref:FadR/GntR family transcriptional regulator n=1 Tax=Paenibacillus sp. FSL H7-0331 TaxID=1920421 RepID=UPI00096CCDFE|nr:FadR/GntR family transcriptional regulator [Paenibacillus sp. FSL H7-0331]OMF16098.1 GntR family transcriptional regulator [Paenibacillus sp. FSL H7-0331]
MLIPKASTVVSEALREQIMKGDWLVGSRLPSVEKLAELFQVGRSTIREALASLKAQGWVDVRHGGGTFVLKDKEPAIGIWQAPEIQDIKQLKAWLELRYILETESASLAAGRRSAEQLSELKQIIQEMMTLQEENQLDQADIRFHVAIAQASGNPLLAGTLESLFSSMGPIMRESRRLWLFAEQSEASRLSDEHFQLVEAIEQGSATLAKKRMASHLRKVEQTLQRLSNS